jgi:hypothetical protein
MPDKFPRESKTYADAAKAAAIVRQLGAPEVRGSPDIK